MSSTDELDAARATIRYYEAKEALRYTSARTADPDLVLAYLEARDGGLPHDAHGRLDVHALDRLITDAITVMPSLRAGS